MNIKTKQRFLVVSAVALVCVMTGCGKQKDVESEKAASAVQTEDSAEEKAASAEFTLEPYAMEGFGCAVEIPDTFSASSDSSVISGTLSFEGVESDDDIYVIALDSVSEDEFASYQEDDLFGLASFSTTLPELQYFREVTVPNAKGVSCAAYIGETLGTINGEDTYVTLMAVNCPEQEKMYVVGVRDKTGEYQDYRDNLANYFHLSANGFVVENHALKEAPESEPLSFSNDKIGYQISLPQGWSEVTGDSGILNESVLTMGYADYNIFMDKHSNYIMVAAKSTEMSDAAFYAATEQAKDSWGSSDSDELVSTRECTVYDCAAFQAVVRHSVSSSNPQTSVNWLVNRTGENAKLFLIRYFYHEESDAEFANTLMNSITFH